MDDKSAASANVTSNVGGYRFSEIRVQFGQPATEAPASEENDKGNAPAFRFLSLFADGVKRTRTAFLDFLFLFLSVSVILLTIYVTLSDRRLIIEPIKSPAALQELGLSEDVAAHRLMDAILEIEQAAKRHSGTFNVTHAGTFEGRDSGYDVIPKSRSIDIAIPEFGALLDTFLYYVKQLLTQHDVRITGEFICSSRECTGEDIYLRIRIFDPTPTTFSLQAIGDMNRTQWERDYFRDAAVGVLEQIDPIFAAAYFTDRDQSRAVTIARSVLRSNPDNPEDVAQAYNIIGVVYLHAGEYEVAAATFQKALDFDPNFVEAHSNLGNVLLRENKPKEAIAQYRTALEINPDFASAYANIADAHLRLGDVAEAIATYDTAIALDPQNAYAFANLGDAWARRGDQLKAAGDETGRAQAYDKAFGYFRTATDIIPELVFAHVSWGLALERDGQREPALERIEKAVDLASFTPVANKDGALAFAYASLGDIRGPQPRRRNGGRLLPESPVLFVPQPAGAHGTCRHPIPRRAL